MFADFENDRAWRLQIDTKVFPAKIQKRLLNLSTGLQVNEALPSRQQDNGEGKLWSLVWDVFKHYNKKEVINS